MSSSKKKLKELQKNQLKHGLKHAQSNLTYESDSVSDKGSDKINDDDDYNSYDEDSDEVSDKDNDESSDDDDYSIYDEDSDVDNNLSEENINYIKETIERIKNKIPEEIVGADVYDDQFTLIIKFQGDYDEGEKIQVKVAKKLWPKIVIDYFEKYLAWI